MMDFGATYNPNHHTPSPDDKFNPDWILAALLSSPCPRCANDDMTTLFNVKENDDTIIARHCGKCGECFGFDDTCDIKNLENLQTAFKDGDNTMADPCPECGNSDIYKFTLQENEHGGMCMQCVVCESTKEAIWVDYETDNQKQKIRLRKFSELSRGDHIAWWSGFRYWYHAIVESIDPVESTVNLIGFWIEKPLKPITVRRITQKVDLKKEKIYRIEYTKSHDTEVVIDRAISRLGSAEYSVVTNNTYTFATWCKIGKHNHDIDYSVIRGVLGKVLPKAFDKVPITDAGCLKVADHIAWHRTGYWHHGIITNIEDDTITVTEFRNSGSENKEKNKAEILQTKYDKWNIVENVYLFKYPVDEDPAIVVKRALLCIGQKGYHVLKNNCEHFATWCKTGVVASTQIQTLVKSITSLFEKSPLYLARIAFGLTSLGLDVAVPAIMPLCGGALILGALGSVRVAIAAVNLHRNKKQTRTYQTIYVMFQGQLGPSYVVSWDSLLGELFMPIGGGVIGSVIGWHRW